MAEEHSCKLYRERMERRRSSTLGATGKDAFYEVRLCQCLHPQGEHVATVIGQRLACGGRAETCCISPEAPSWLPGPVRRTDICWGSRLKSPATTAGPAPRKLR